MQFKQSHKLLLLISFKPLSMAESYFLMPYFSALIATPVW
uniref:WbsH n=1 Tax=Vibrio parahaemolyticus TaxID=670 RepID=A0A5P4S6Q8_VIBPH|nr:WbsH [Vibrio parahaemolyticus]QFC18161.1 WbsH [Vibrio parahaemolyticus]